MKQITIDLPASATDEEAEQLERNLESYVSAWFALHGSG